MNRSLYRGLDRIYMSDKKLAGDKHRAVPGLGLAENKHRAVPGVGFSTYFLMKVSGRANR